VAATRALDQKATPTMGTRLQDKTALVTGATSNIRRGIVTAFAAEAHMSSSAAAAGARHRDCRSDPRGERARGLHRSGSRWPGLFTRPHGDGGNPADVMMRGAPAETSGTSDAIAKAAVYLASDKRVRTWNRHRRRRRADECRRHRRRVKHGPSSKARSAQRPPPGDAETRPAPCSTVSSPEPRGRRVRPTGAALAARAVSSALPPGAKRPRKNTAVSASR
jgi:hypothetical protein